MDWFLLTNEAKKITFNLGSYLIFFLWCLRVLPDQKWLQTLQPCFHTKYQKDDEFISNKLASTTYFHCLKLQEKTIRAKGLDLSVTKTLLMLRPLATILMEKRSKANPFMLAEHRKRPSEQPNSKRNSMLSKWREWLVIKVFNFTVVIK